MKFAILATIHTIKCIIDKGLLVLETPSGGAISSEYLIAAEQKINHDPLPWLLKLITANGDTPQAIYEIFANIDDASWSDEINGRIAVKGSSKQYR